MHPQRLLKPDLLITTSYGRRGAFNKAGIFPHPFIADLHIIADLHSGDFLSAACIAVILRYPWGEAKFRGAGRRGHWDS